MKRLIPTLLLLVLLAPGAAAQDETTRLKEALENGLVSFSYSYLSDGEIPVTGKGQVTVQGSRYYTEGNGMKIWCDSTLRWTLDVTAKEAYIETVASSPDILSNPVPYLNGLSGLKSENGTISGIYEAGGHKIRFSITDIKISPKTEDLGVFSFDVATLDKSWVLTDLR